MANISQSCTRRIARAIVACFAAVAFVMSLECHTTLAQRPAARPNPGRAARDAAPPRTGVVAGPVAPELANRLAAPFQTLVERRPLRELLTQMSEVGGFNLWLDRLIDPDQSVSLPPGPRTLFGTISQAAAAAGHDSAAIGNLVLVGRPEWVASVVAVMLSQPEAYLTDAPPKIITWPEATTPSEALRIAAGAKPLTDEHGGDPRADRANPRADRANPRAEKADAQTANTELLPHDLWPAVRWQGVSRPLATLLVAAQFNQMPATLTPQAAANDQPPPLIPLAAPESFALQYPSGPHAAALRREVLAADPQAKVKPSPASGRIEVVGSAAAQVAAVRAHLTHASTPVNAKGTLDRVRFSLTLQGISAASVFEQLANTAVHRLVIADDARAACQSLVMLNIQDKTIRELVDLVAQQVGVKAEWTDGQLQITRDR